MHDGAKAALGIGHLAKGGQAQGLRGLGDVVQVRVQQFHEAGKISADFLLRPTHVAVQLMLDKRGNQAVFQLFLDGAGSHGFPVVHQIMHLVDARSETGR